ncbi:SixA phosphatase family protein [Actibacterium sp. XHP0104]|uniref:SixA phosphatase family protein n=1 Tax=Actibacterium sp. XHP0104 TaxID=2984335 RepID=UPI0021E9AD71|nr:histidine phosphatase family protein [Actibacterium sp. XHP0104]MCV2882388.1 histidine phosphatase family protein [Actibacterium sp. XHP0104]
MSLRLILVRHAKSSWDDLMVDDHDRVLNRRGRATAPLMARFLATHGHRPALVVSSTARRTLETWDRMAPIFGGTDMPPLHPEPKLYHASADTMLAVLHRCPPSTVMMLGHNPGIGDFASDLLAEQPRHPSFHAYPTCATLVADFPARRWSEVRFGTGRVVDFAIPADMTD